MRGYFVGAGLAIAVAAMATGAMTTQAMAQSEIKIGEINSYSLLPAFTEPYRKGWQLAVEEINAAGGINGKKLVVISKDDGGKPADAQTAANELVSSENVAMLTGTFLSNIGLAVSDFANQKKVFFLAAEPLTDAITWSKGNRYTFRLRPSNYMQAAMLVAEAAKLPAKRWATIAPNYEYGQSAVAVFKKLMSEKRPDIQWVDEQWPPQGKIDAGPVVQATADAVGEAIAAPTPCSSRAMTSVASSQATPQSTEAMVNRATPTMKVRLRPMTSPRRPPSSMRPPKVNTYAVMTQLRPASERLSSSWILGSATIATVLSIVASNCIPPIATTAAMKRRDGIQAGVLLGRAAPSVGPPGWPPAVSPTPGTRVGRARSDTRSEPRLVLPSASRWMAARSASLRAVISGYLTVILRTL